MSIIDDMTFNVEVCFHSPSEQQNTTICTLKYSYCGCGDKEDAKNLTGILKCFVNKTANAENFKTEGHALLRNLTASKR